MYYALLQATTAGAGEGGTQAAGGGLLGMLLPFALMFAIFYFLLIRPQQKKQKDHQKMLEALKENDIVATSSGIIGKIVAIKKDKDSVVLRVDDTTNTKIEFQRHAIAGVIGPKEDKPAEAKK